VKETLSLILTLTVICLVAGLLLAFANDLTKERIAEALEKERTEAIMKALPPCDNNPVEETKTVTENDKEWTFFIGRLKDTFSGVAFETSTSKGFGGEIKLMVGVTAEDKINNIIILGHKETPGLGAKISSDEFRNGFSGKDIVKTNWKVKKDGGDIDAITAATISSRAVTEAVKTGLDVYIKNRETILKETMEQ